eukprot:TRINITY_DN7173_c0_g1_i2.p1 TRINITY_DN7173_c0_g1~~TRINITY_DN7173_c0_g1_i2.p1  ORF type:complete len:258 (-),score=28.56 TRINITY_DN7173_c0_g1_i2:2111-2884(-)
MGGRITLIKSMMTNLPMYYLSILNCPISVINKIEKLQWDFLWQGRCEERKFHLVDWSLVCSSKMEGGLGIKSIRGMNGALLGKWLWSLGDNLEGLRRKVLLAKYGNQRIDWETRESSYNFSLMWKGLVSVTKKFIQNIKYQVRSAEKIIFWKDTWLGDCPLAKKFPELFNCALVKEAKVKNCFERHTNKEEVIWCQIFRRNLKDVEARQFISLLNLVSDVIITEQGEDIRIWKASKDGSFSISSFYSTNSTRTMRKP